MNGTYRLLKVLGAGSSGKVWLAEHAQSKVKYAIKIIKKERVHSFKGELLKELEVLKSL